MTENTQQITPELCRAGRGQLGWRQSDLANASGLHKQLVYKFETGGSVEELSKQKLIKAFNDVGVAFVVDNDKQTMVHALAPK